jgi:hypothetical protein
MIIFGLLFGILTIITHYIIVIFERLSRIPIIGWLFMGLNMLLKTLRVVFAVVTDKFHPEGNMRAKILALTKNISEEVAEDIVNNKVDNNSEEDNIEQMKRIAGDIIDDVISTNQHVRIYKKYDDFIKVFKNFPTFKEYEEASSVVIYRNKTNYKIVILKEEKSFLVYWEKPKLSEIIEDEIIEEKEKNNLLEDCFKNINNRKLEIFNDEIEESIKNGYTHQAEIMRIGNNYVNPDEQPKVYIKFEDNYEKIIITFNTDFQPCRYTFYERIDNTVYYGEGSVKYQENYGEASLYMHSGTYMEIGMSLSKLQNLNQG